MNNATSADEIRQEILIYIKANNIPVTGDLWLSLAFCSKEGLAAIARELHIDVR